MANISAHFLKVALRSAERRGLDPEKIMQDIELDRALLDDPNGLISGKQLCRLWRYLWDALNDEFLGFTATPSKRGSFPMVCRLAYQSPNLSRLFREAHRVYEFLGSDLNIELNVINEQEVAIQAPLANDEFDIDHFCTEYWLLYWHRLACWLTNTRTLPLRAEFSYSAPAHVAEYHKIFQCPLYFDQNRTALIFPADFAEQRPVRTREELYRFLNNLPAEFMDVPGNETSLESRIRLYVLDRCGDVLEFPRFEAIAARFHMSPKTLQRKLRNEAINYQKIKESIRRDFVVENLRNPALSIKEIAYKVGLLETSSLSRMFIKWTGMSPVTYRREVLQQHY